MSKIKLLVEIDEEDYGDFCDWFESVPSELYDAKPYDDSGDLISREALRRIIKTECNPYGKPTIDFKSGKKVLKIIDNAPTVEKTILKRRDVNKCLNCSYCCEASINSNGEVYIMCNLGAQCPTKEGNV